MCSQYGEQSVKEEIINILLRALSYHVVKLDTKEFKVFLTGLLNDNFKALKYFKQIKEIKESKCVLDDCSK